MLSLSWFLYMILYLSLIRLSFIDWLRVNLLSGLAFYYTTSQYRVSWIFLITVFVVRGYRISQNCHESSWNTYCYSINMLKRAQYKKKQTHSKHIKRTRENPENLSWCQQTYLYDLNKMSTKRLICFWQQDWTVNCKHIHTL